jgi:hypothetical protein
VARRRGRERRVDYLRQRLQIYILRCLSESLGVTAVITVVMI